MRLFSTLSRRLEELAPTGPVRMYVCGPTVYDLIHIGNARPFVVFDALRQYLASQGQEVIYVQNITDVDDKIINRAREEGQDPREIADRYAEEYFRDLALLGVEPPTHSPRATAYVGKMIELIEKLIAKGHAYETSGSVYFSVRSFPEYGKLSGRAIDELRSGARVEPGEEKKDPLDFALWKAAKPSEPKWPSPWGDGRPGWHTECVVMAIDLLGETIDIHAGGNDLIFPHHENEIAQAESLTGRTFARIWLHNGLITVGKEEMHKSLRNFEYARDVVAEYGTEAVRYFLLSAHYRKPLAFSSEALAAAKKAVDGVYDFLWVADLAPEGDIVSAKFLEKLAELAGRFHAALGDDFNTPEAISVLHEIIGVARRSGQGGSETAEIRSAAALVRKLSLPFGLFQKARPLFPDLSQKLVELLIELRAELRQEGKFALADRIRARLDELGIELRDTPQGTTWTQRIYS